MKPKGPRIEAPLIVATPRARFADLVDAISLCPPLPLRQPWRTRPERAFRGGEVRIAHGPHSILVLANLEDDDVFTRATAGNQPMWELGDALEIFLRPPDTEAYWEFHVTPSNHRLRLRFPHPRAVYEHKAEIGPDAKGRAIIRPFLLRRDFKSVAERRKGGWDVFASIPLRLMDRGIPGDGETWTFSFARYDYTRGEEAPVRSTTSVHGKPDFHDQRGWGTVVF